MKNKLFLIGLVGLGSSLMAARQDPLAPGGGGREDPAPLERVEPVPSTGNPDARVFGRKFDRDEWRSLLGTSDLDQREKHFEDLVRRVRIDPLARSFVEELARDTSAPELAWTARLLLRELGPVRSPLSGMLPGHPLQLNQHLEEMLRELWSDPDGLSFFLHPPPSGRIPNLQGMAAGSRSVAVHQSPEGARIVISEDVQGERKDRVYEGASIDEILRGNPELARELEELGVALGDASGNLDLRFDSSGGPWKDLLRPFEYGEGREALERFFSDQGTFQRSFAPQSQSRPVRTDVLGVKPVPLTPEHAAELALEPGVGLFVVSTYPGTIAHLLGVRSGHVLVELNGETLRSDADITAVMRARAPDQELTLRWIDELGQRQTKTWRPAEARATTPRKMK